MTDYDTIARGRALPDETTFCEWLRVYYNDQISAAKYGSEELRAYESILGSILDTGSDLDEDETRLDLLRSDLWAEITEEGVSEVSRNLHGEVYETIVDYQERTMLALPLSGSDMGLIFQALGVWVKQSEKEDGHKPYYLAELETRFGRFFKIEKDYLITAVFTAKP